jgi:hypothetical protein
MTGAEQNGAALWHANAGLFHRRFEIGGRDFGARCDVAEIDADARHDAVLQRIFIHRLAIAAEVPRRVDVGAGVVRHRDEHRGKPVHLAGFGEGFLVGLPDAVDDWGMARIGRSALIELTTEIDDLHAWASVEAGIVG